MILDVDSDAACGLAAQRLRKRALEGYLARIPGIGADGEPTVLSQLNPGRAHVDGRRGIDRCAVDARNADAGTRFGAQHVDGNFPVDLRRKFCINGRIARFGARARYSFELLRWADCLIRGLFRAGDIYDVSLQVEITFGALFRINYNDLAIGQPGGGKAIGRGRLFHRQGMAVCDDYVPALAFARHIVALTENSVAVTRFLAGLVPGQDDGGTARIGESYGVVIGLLIKRLEAHGLLRLDPHAMANRLVKGRHHDIVAVMLQPADQNIAVAGVQKRGFGTLDDALGANQVRKIDVENLRAIQFENATSNRFPRAVVFHPDDRKLAVVQPGDRRCPPHGGSRGTVASLHGECCAGIATVAAERDGLRLAILARDSKPLQHDGAVVIGAGHLVFDRVDDRQLVAIAAFLLISLDGGRRDLANGAVCMGMQDYFAADLETRRAVRLDDQITVVAMFVGNREAFSEAGDGRSSVSGDAVADEQDRVAVCQRSCRPVLVAQSQLDLGQALGSGRRSPGHQKTVAKCGDNRLGFIRSRFRRNPYRCANLQHR